MKIYERINLHAENIADAIYKGTKDVMPSVLSLINWVEHNFGIKVKVSFTNSGEFRR